MKPFTTHNGLVAPLDRVNVDTDQMVPKQFCKLVTREGYGRVLFYDWRYLPKEIPNPEFVLNWPQYRGASILLARANFGCGSSREHAAWAVLDYGLQAILAPSFADIFYNNCFKNGVLPVVLPEEFIDALFARAGATAGLRLSVDLDEQVVTDGMDFKAPFAIDGFRKKCLLKGLNDIEMILECEPKIAAYEMQTRPQAAIYSSLS